MVTTRILSLEFICFAILTTLLSVSSPELACTVKYFTFLKSFNDRIAAELVVSISEIFKSRKSFLFLIFETNSRPLEFKS